ncbi:MAG: tryptophan synthase subunit alpha [Gammaproteobacteria bacterium]|jgi:tryptophan synthase alpha chain|nr:tryptophan synthase subunit alpha [Gammaproteobacteria bacterium]MBQ0774027.1 tryptophan synthase subunit alpha [Gammaproteobacteria bacterium]
MSRIANCFEQLSSTGRKALIPFITAGDPAPAHTVGFMHAMVEAGADIIELGVPFSDPMADGPVIQLACERSLAAGTSLSGVLKMVAEFRQSNSDTPVVLMGYLNPIEAMGYEVFADRCVEVGVDGVLLVDLPPEESGDVAPLFRERHLDLVFLLAPTTSEERVALIAKAGSGYLYYVSLKGVTGAATLDVDSVQAKVDTIRKHTKLPVGVGFGIKDADSAKAVSAVADGVVVGSALVQRIADNQGRPEVISGQLQEVLSAMRQAMDAH